MKPPVGYLVCHKDGLRGERGQFYDYILSENGIWIEAEGPFFAARVLVADAEVRGLAPLEPALVLRHGLIPHLLFDLGINSMFVDTSREKYVAVTWNDGYHLYVPEQEAGATSTKYLVPDNTVIDLHSHGGMGAWFSKTDNEDELGLKIFGVVGRLPDRPQLRLRVGIYGYHHPVAWDEVFAGSLEGVDDLLDKAVEVAEDENEEDLGVFAHPIRYFRGLWRH